VKRAVPTDIELHWARFDFGYRGCLTQDVYWSCSADTYVDPATGSVVFPAPEAGFLHILGGDYTALNLNNQKKLRHSPDHRIWYSFYPALESPETKPLAVFFNGGPGFTTAGDLYSFNTGPYTLDPDIVGSADYASNDANNWQEFANLLYIDAPATGFSYPSNSDPNKKDIGIDMDRDGGIFLSVITRFLRRHPKLIKNPVVLVGESYGGTRATFILKWLLRYDQLNQTSSDYQDIRVLNDLQAYFWSAFGTNRPSKAQIVSKFGQQILIQPAVVGEIQDNLNLSLNPIYQGLTSCSSTCIGTNTCDEYSCDKPKNWIFVQADSAADKLTRHLSTLQQVFGVDPRTIRWMFASERGFTHGRGGCNPLTNPNCPAADEMNNYFGRLDWTKDSYFWVQNGNVATRYGNTTGPDAARTWYTPGAGQICGLAFLDNLFQGVATFITYAEYDGMIYPPSIADAFNHSVFATLGYYEASASNDIGDSTRPGRIALVMQPNNFLLHVTMPHYLAGHSVPMHEASGAGQAHQLREDARRWLINTRR
jgi:hypothetical protein